MVLDLVCMHVSLVSLQETPNVQRDCLSRLDPRHVHTSVASACARNSQWPIRCALCSDHTDTNMGAFLQHICL